MRLIGILVQFDVAIESSFTGRHIQLKSKHLVLVSQDVSELWSGEHTLRYCTEPGLTAIDPPSKAYKDSKRIVK